ncbi:Mdj2p KNAG_0K02590 [Huiozyma naganishii CBS 8797]|uniref:J domain-containing protein n=1 Tax=Huiozyma naganishii (strain ATCC MYA-139 / BCRC 22969 / CBS 8797 / KCTC 17520 / NBRC 10181 / NCYC 3082 / Yp74L-3) TaxID=1071383 RepID=J7S3H2_HUIN7|nr:hypothetical protein KNAG_0K02590 [Kazachstania naganishii CBS 8797]CCK72622.1 hypothetical protein KNAG_0K02590 [Kazachstania naganishii CBS 8797]
MVLPLIIGTGIALLGVGTQTGLRAWKLYKTLTPLAIAHLNGVRIQQEKLDLLRHDGRFRSSMLNPLLRKRLEQYYGGFHHTMSEPEALLVLNISSDEIKRLDQKLLKLKHRKAVLHNHPDKGGSPYMAAKINEARDLIERSVLLKRN